MMHDHVSVFLITIEWRVLRLPMEGMAFECEASFWNISPYKISRRISELEQILWV
jgi:hypothetical protein